jgi:O-antigen/teichoic acid export membrane protein
MIKKFLKIRNSPTLMNWLNNGVVFMHGIIVTPLTLKQFDNIEYSFWMLLQTLLAFSLLIDSGFGHTLGRTVSFIFGGATKIPNNIKEFKELKGSKGEPNYELLNRLLGTSARIYGIVSWSSVFLIGIVGTLMLWNLLELSNHNLEMWISFFVMLVLTYVSIQSVKWNSFMMGTQQVAIQFRIGTSLSFVQLIAFLLILLFAPNMVYLICVLVIKTMITFWIKKRLVIKKLNEKGNFYSRKRVFDKELFKPLWKSTWRLGISQWGSFFTKSGISIIISQVKDPALMASFLFTNRILDFIQKIAEGQFRANIPVVYSLMAEKNYKTIRNKISSSVFIMLFIFLAAFAGFGAFGNQLLAMLDIDKTILPMDIYLLFSATLILVSHSKLHGTVYVGTNSVPFYIPSIITGGLTVLLGFIVLPHYGLLGVVAVKFTLMILFNAWFSVYLNLNLLEWKVFQYIKDIFIIGFSHFRKSIATYIR